MRLGISKDLGAAVALRYLPDPPPEIWLDIELIEEAPELMAELLNEEKEDV